MHSLQSSQVLLLASPDKVSSNRQPRGMDGQNGGGNQDFSLYHFLMFYYNLSFLLPQLPSPYHL